MSKIIAITRAVGAGITALYHAVEAADHSTKGEGSKAYEAALVFETARADFIGAFEDLTQRSEPKIQGGDMYFGSVRPVFHGSDES